MCGFGCNVGPHMNVGIHKGESPLPHSYDRRIESVHGSRRRGRRLCLLVFAGQGGQLGFHGPERSLNERNQFLEFADLREQGAYLLLNIGVGLLLVLQRLESLELAVQIGEP